MATAAARVEAAVALPRRRRTARARTNPLRNGVTWIVVLAVLLAGVVALNVAVLQLNVKLDRLSRERAQLRAKNAALASQLSRSGAAPRIQTLARQKLGVVYASSDDTTFVELGR